MRESLRGLGSSWQRLQSASRRLGRRLAPFKTREGLSLYFLSQLRASCRCACNKVLHTPKKNLRKELRPVGSSCAGSRAFGF